ncbi:TRAF family member-associated NF-kappa-B activator isoform X2 [Pleurodeles waltl]|uniref:TRAF family member-associated NF-kappa-B activator isoform X2 n=1 Tax=Pleurodeles waltl TaxID=8319 RepID=UPI003709ACA6
MADPLNKAYEAFRMAVIDRDNARKELKQKSESYEQRICELQKEMASQSRLIAHLMSQLADCPGAGRGNAYGLLQEETELRKRDGPLHLTTDQLQEQLKVAVQAEKHFKEQWEKEQIKLKLIEEESIKKGKTFESLLNSRDAQIMLLRNKLKEANERLDKVNCINIQICETEVQKKRKECPAGQDVMPAASGVSAIQISERENVEKIFSEMKEEFRQICKLTREQTDRLHKFNQRKETAADGQFSMPIQCTDSADEQAEGHFKHQVKSGPNVRACTASVTPSTPEKTVLSSPVATENALQPIYNLQLDDNTLSLNEPGCCPSEDKGNSQITQGIENIAFIDRVQSPHQPDTFKQDKTSPLTAEDHSTRFKYPTNETSDKNKSPLELTKREIRGPQQTFWKPYPDKGDDLRLAPEYAESELNDSGVCEFCQAVFPPSSTSRGDFFRHLNSHFKEQV